MAIDGPDDVTEQHADASSPSLRRIGFSEAWQGCPKGTKKASGVPCTPEAWHALGAPLAWLSLGRLRPRRASFRFARQIKDSMKSTTPSKQTAKYPLTNGPYRDKTAAMPVHVFSFLATLLDT